MVSNLQNITEQLAALTPAKRSLLELRMMQKRLRNEVPKASIRPRSAQESAPLSNTQQGLWVLNQLTPGASTYHTPMAARLTGNLDVPALHAALNEIVSRHEALRTTFVVSEGAPRQLVSKELTLELPLIDLSRLGAIAREEEAQLLLRQEVSKPFDLSQAPLIRAVLVRLKKTEHILLVTMHHIVTDGWSMGIFHRELSELYEAFKREQPSPLADLPIQYGDFAEWQREWLAGENYRSQLAYWKKKFATLPAPLELPTDHPRPSAPANHSFRGSQQSCRLSRELTKELKQFCRKENVTLFMALMAAYKVLLHRYTSETDIVVGTPIAGRQLPETEDLIGLFINTLPLRSHLAGNLSFREVLMQVRTTALEAFAHQDLPFEQLVKELQPERTLAHNPLFQVLFVLQSEEIPPVQLSELVTEHLRIDHPKAHFDLTLDIAERDGEVVCEFEFNADLFEPETIERLMEHFQILLSGAIANPDLSISRMQLLSEAERRRLLIEWNDTRTDYPADKTIQQLFEQQVNDRPEATALVWENGEMSYRELNSRANRLANYLRRRGITPDTRVAICLERSPELMVTLLAILKAGGAYVPLDPDYPEVRLKLMLKDARANVLITQAAWRERLPQTDAEVVCLDKLESEIARESAENLATKLTTDNLAYVMYTSGSTGKPKGVAVTHRNVVRLVKNTNYASFSTDEVFLQCSTISFDASTFEIWGSLLNGARLVLLPPGPPSLAELGQALKRYQVTTLWLTAGLFHLMVDNHLDDLRSVRQLLAGGDVLSVPHVRKVFTELSDCRLINGYGPTESTTFTCCYPLNDLSRVNSSVPIGFPISNTTVYVLDRYQNPAPIGVPGELFIGGDGLARGYLDQPQLNAERFVRNPFSDLTDTRLYRTGDLVRYRAGGEIEFIGRLDNQVKVRGFRVELGEIEAALVEHSAVREAVVLAKKDQGDKHLAAYLTASAGETIAIDELRFFLQQKLPDHMVPSVFVVLESLPLTPMGKVDRRALLATNGFKPQAPQQFSNAGDELELKLTRVWEKVLNVPRIGIDDNFFELGGHSLLAVRLFAQIEKLFGRNLPLATLFQAPTIRQLAQVMRRDGWRGAWSSLVMIQNGGQRRPFFCIHAAGGNVLEYRDLAQLLGSDQPFYGLQAKGLNGKEEPHTTIQEMAVHYLKEMREVQPEGPYLLGGRSSGGTIAFEMACRLAAEGQEVGLLALFDTYPAGYFKIQPGSESRRQRAHRFWRKLLSHVANLRQLKAPEQIAYVLRKLKYVPAKVKHKIYRRGYKLYKRYGRPLPPVLRNIEEINFAAVKDYEPQTYSGNVTLFLASDLTADYDLHDGWRELVQGDIDTYEIPGNHINIIKDPHVRPLAEKLRACLDKAQKIAPATDSPSQPT